MCFPYLSSMSLFCSSSSNLLLVPTSVFFFSLLESLVPIFKNISCVFVEVLCSYFLHLSFFSIFIIIALNLYLYIACLCFVCFFCFFLFCLKQISLSFQLYICVCFHVLGKSATPPRLERVAFCRRVLVVSIALSALVTRVR